MATNSGKKHSSWDILAKNVIFHRGGFACEVYKERYIVIAGGTSQFFEELSSAVMYDTFTHTYISLPDLPFSGFCGGTVLKDYFYISKYESCEVYRICLSPGSRSKWQSVTKVKPYADNIVSDKNHLYLINTDFDIMYSYDPVLKVLSILTSIPTFREAFAAAVVGNQIFVIGGFKYPVEVLSTMEVYDIITQTWSKAPSLPIRLHLASAIAFKRWIIVIGGYNENWDYNTQTLIYDTIEQKWMQHNSVLLTPCFHNEIVVIGSRMISLGGWDLGNMIVPLQILNMKELIPDMNWKLIKHFVLLRQLVGCGRAHPICAMKNNSEETSIFSNTDKIIQYVFTELMDDMFRYILSFLI